MNGFVTNYASAKGAKPPVAGSQPPVMGYFTADQAPVTDFFAKNFATCDHWFSALPAGTQPNRLMAMSGFSKIDVNQVPLPDQDLVYDWLTRNGIRWRVYHQDMPFFAMMLRWIPDILREEHFRPFSYDPILKDNASARWLMLSREDLRAARKAGRIMRIGYKRGLAWYRLTAFIAEFLSSARAHHFKDSGK